jgi:hypothetical protein
MVRTVKTWFRCQYQGCTVETDTGYEMLIEGKKVMVCQSCMEKIQRKKGEKKDLSSLLEGVGRR